MKRLYISALLAVSLTSQAGTLGTSSFSPWPIVIGGGGGFTRTTNLGESVNFPILNPTTDEFYSYTPTHRDQTKGLYELLLGTEHPIFSQWLLQGGIAYSQSSSFKTQGNYIQGADSQSADQYQYQYHVLTRQLLAQTKWMYPWKNRFYPYFLIGLGASFNQAYNYSNSAPPTLTFTRDYSKNNNTSFAYRVGLGFDVDLWQHIRLGIAYRFADYGRVSLGSATIQQTAVSGTLSKSNLYANEALVQLTFII